MPQVLQDIKDEIDVHIGQQVTVSAQVGRKKVERREGTIVESYNSLFVLELNEAEGSFERVSYSFTDILTSHIELEFAQQAKKTKTA